MHHLQYVAFAITEHRPLQPQRMHNPQVVRAAAGTAN